jgi:hypothetical protein
LLFANETFTLCFRTNAVGLLFDDRGRLSFYTNAELAAQIKGLLIGHAELFGKLMNAQDLGQVLRL